MPDNQPSDKERLATLEADSKNQKDLNKSFVTRDEFLPTKLISYGLAGIILTSVAISLIGHMLIK